VLCLAFKAVVLVLCGRLSFKRWKKCEEEEEGEEEEEEEESSGIRVIHVNSSTYSKAFLARLQQL